MARIVLDPDDVNQDRVVTTTNGAVVVLDEADSATLRRIARQLHIHRSTYAHAFRADDDATSDAVVAGELSLDDLSPLHQRVAELLAGLVKRGGRSARDLDPTSLLETQTWASSGGAARQLTDLTPSHRHNLISWLERNSDDLRSAFLHVYGDGDSAESRLIEPRDPWVAGTPLHRRLTALVNAETARDQAIDQARQTARRIAFERRGEWPSD